MSKPNSTTKTPLGPRRTAVPMPEAPASLLAWVPDLLAIAGLVAVVAIVVAAVA